MKTVVSTTQLFGINATTPIAESAAEFNKLAKSETATLDYANAHMTAHDTLTQWRNNLCAAVFQTTKVPFKTAAHPTKPGVTVRKESSNDYINRVVAEGKMTVEQLVKLAIDTESGKTPILGSDGKQLVVDGKPQFFTIVFDPSESEAGVRNVAPTKGDLAAIVALRKHPDFTKKLAALAKLTNTVLTPASTDIELANAYGTFRRATEREALVAAQKKMAAAM